MDYYLCRCCLYKKNCKLSLQGSHLNKILQWGLKVYSPVIQWIQFSYIVTQNFLLACPRSLIYCPTIGEFQILKQYLVQTSCSINQPFQKLQLVMKFVLLHLVHRVQFKNIFSAYNKIPILLVITSYTGPHISDFPQTYK